MECYHKRYSAFFNHYDETTVVHSVYYMDCMCCSVLLYAFSVFQKEIFNLKSRVTIKEGLSQKIQCFFDQYETT